MFTRLPQDLVSQPLHLQEHSVQMVPLIVAPGIIYPDLRMPSGIAEQIPE